jgi:hypothetical protein
VQVEQIVKAAAEKVLEMGGAPDRERFFARATGSYIRGKECTGVRL